MKITILGSGTSTGVPQVGCECAVCTSNDLHDKRLRCSSLIEIGDVRILVDCGSDFREQMMNLPFLPIDAVILTHEHYDHVGGLDDLRPFCKFNPIPIYADNHTCEALYRRMPYCFEKEHRYPGVPDISLHEIQPFHSFFVKDVEILPFTIIHGKMPILGYRIGRLGYITDMLMMPDVSYDVLKGLDVLIINALRIEPHRTHQCLSEAIVAAKRISASETYFIHMSHQIGLHEEISKSLPLHYYFAYDGLQITL